jgi:site-specific recombinase XerC
LAVRRFGRWLHAEGELAEDPLAGMRPPKLDAKVVRCCQTISCGGW